MSDALIVRLALEWLKAEREARGEEAPTAADDDLAIAADRVYQVLAGEVRWTDASPGDKHIWRGRFRDVEKFDRWWRNSRTTMEHFGSPAEIISTDDDRYNQTAPRRRPGTRQPVLKQSRRRKEYANYYDTVLFCDESFQSVHPSMHQLRRDQAWAHLFNNSNVGSIRYSNLTVGGQMDGETTFYIDTMYACPVNLGRFMVISDCVRVALSIGKRQQGPVVHLRELLMGIPVKTIVTPRQEFGVHLEHFIPASIKIPTFEMSVHLEGVVVLS